MKKYILAAALLATTASTTLFISSCSKKEEENTTEDYGTLKSKVLTDFVDVLVNPLYADFKAKAQNLNDAVVALSTQSTQENLIKAQDAWRAVRVLWEQSEGFLIGPVDYDNLDPYMDTWPTDHNAMDNLLNSNTALTVDYLAGLQDTEDEVELTLRGFHPLEYLLWNIDGNRQANTLTARQKEYMVALAADILNNVTKLQNGWLPAGDYFAKEITHPGKEGSRYETNRDALEAIANALTEICEEVAAGKMHDPFVLPGDSTISESPYAHNSLADFKNNIIGAKNVYNCSFGGSTGKSLSTLVKYNNATLDQEIKQKFEVAINTFDGITTTFEQAIYVQRSQVQNVIDKIEDLKSSLEALIPHLNTYVKD